MRVISGLLKGRKLEGYDIDGTRPTMDYVKESMFAMVQDYLYDAKVLDLFAGSGSLGIEAISNGAEECTFVDKNIIAIKTIEKNIKNFKIEQKCTLINKDYKNALNVLKNKKFDIIILDPPYKMSVKDDVLNSIISNNVIAKEGIIICETEEIIDSFNNNLEIIKCRKYGQKNITILKCVNIDKTNWLCKK